MLLEKLSSQQYHEHCFHILKQSDNQIYELIRREYERAQNSLQLVAAENWCSRAVLASLGSIIQNKTVEGFPQARFHGGCQIVDQVEQLAITRAKKAFSAKYVNVQPHSCSQANQIVFTALLERGDKILTLSLDQGGHWSHGAKGSFATKFFNIENYYVDRKTCLLDYDAIRDRAIKVKPKLIICGASVYPRTIDFKRFREIADEVGAYLLADVSHIAGLIIAGAHPSPVNYAHFTTTSTYKAAGPRGGLIVMGTEFNQKIKLGKSNIALWRLIEKTTFPGVQGTPYLNNIAAKAVFFQEALSDEYKARQFKIIDNAKKLANNLLALGYDVLTKGTDNHMVVVNVANFRKGLTGLVAQKCLEECGIIVDKIPLPYDEKPVTITSGIRLGTPIITKSGMGNEEIDVITSMIDAVLKNVKIISDTEYKIDESFRNETRDKVKNLCSKFPIP